MPLTTRVGRRLPLLRIGVRASQTRSEVLILILAEMCCLIEAYGIVLCGLELDHIAVPVQEAKVDQRLGLEGQSMFGAVVGVYVLRIQLKGCTDEGSLQLRKRSSQDKLLGAWILGCIYQRVDQLDVRLPANSQPPAAPPNSISSAVEFINALCFLVTLMSI